MRVIQRGFERAEKLRRERARNTTLAALSLLAHALAIMLIPGVVAPTALPPVLFVELTAPQLELDPPALVERPPARPEGLLGGTDARATAPIIDSKVRPDAPKSGKPSGSPARGKPVTTKKPAGKASGGGSQTAPQIKKPGTSQSGTASQVAGSTKPSEATAVVPPSPVSVTGTQNDVPAKVADKPVASDKKSAVDRPSAADSGSQQGSGKAPPQKRDTKPGSGGNKSGEGSGGNAGTPGSNAPAGPDSASPSPGRADGTGRGGAGDPGKEPAGGPATAPNLGPPDVPAGPGEAELALLDAYGDRCMTKIRQMARNPEVAREQGHKGKVKFQFTMSSRGKLLGVSITGSSGFDELDSEVKDATRVALASFGEKFPAGIGVDKWTFNRSLQFPLY
jgi:TonB family protein